MFSHIINKVLPVKNAHFETEVMSGIKVLGVYKNNIYAKIENVGFNVNYIYKSIDGGKNWVQFYLGTSPYNHAVLQFAYNNSVVLVWANNTIRRTADGGATWATVLTLSTANKFTLYHGMAQKMQSSQMALFGEYGSGDGDFYVWKTTDMGATWAIALTKAAPTQLRHFHSVTHIPDLNKWIVTWGDGVCGWTESSDDGVTWTDIAVSQNSQVYRTLDVLFLPRGREKGDIVWGTDAGVGSYTGVSPAIYSAPSESLGDTKRLLALPNLCWALGGIGNFLVCGTYYENKDSLRSVYIYASMDEGQTWDILLKLPVNTIDTVGGFTGVHGPDSNGDFYLTGINLKDTSGSTSVKIKSLI